MAKKNKANVDAASEIHEPTRDEIINARYDKDYDGYYGDVPLADKGDNGSYTHHFDLNDLKSAAPFILGVVMIVIVCIILIVH